MRMATAETHYRQPRGRRVRPSEIAPRKQGVIPMTEEMAPVITTEVRANHGRWIVECPFCVSAQLASHSDQRFLCADCGNVQVGGKWVRVVWPNSPEAVEALLARRPVDARNWRPGETAAELRRENAEHGIEEDE